MHLEPIVSGFGDIEKHLFSGYPPASGIPELRQTFSNQLKHDQQLDYDPEKELLITNGVCQSITTALETFINRGDKVVLFDPSFMFYQYAVRCQGARVNWVPTFRIDGELFFEDIALKKAMRGASIIIINHPSNPTVGYFSDHSLQKIVYWAKRFDSLIFSDEVYHRFVSQKAINLKHMFGIYYGLDHFIIYIEPDTDRITNLLSDTARSGIKIDGENVDDSDLFPQWAREFKENMPIEISEKMKEFSGEKISDKKLEKRIMERYRKRAVEERSDANAHNNQDNEVRYQESFRVIEFG